MIRFWNAWYALFLATELPARKDEEPMTWQEIRNNFPEQWLLVEATKAHSKDMKRILEDLAVLQTFSSGKAAMRGYMELHRESPSRELYVLHTEREDLEIEELRWLGIRGVA